MGDAKLKIVVDEITLKKSAKKAERILKRMEDRLSRKRARNRLKKIKLDRASEKRATRERDKETQLKVRRQDQSERAITQNKQRESNKRIQQERRLTREQERENNKRTRMDKRLSRRRARNRLKAIRFRIRSEKKLERDNERQKEKTRQGRQRLVRGAVGGVGRGIGIGIGGILSGAVGALGNFFDPREILDFGRSLAILSGQAGLSPEAQAKLGEDLTTVSLETGVFRTDALRGFEKVLELTGNFKLAEETILSMSKASIGLGTDIEDLATLGASLGNAYGASSKDVIKFFQVLAAQGDKGQVTLRDLSRVAGEVFSTASAIGFKGKRSVAEIGAILQVSGAAGSVDERKTAVKNLLKRFATKESAIKKTFGVDVKKGGEFRSPVSIFKDIIRASKGDIVNIDKVFTEAGASFFQSAKEFRETGKFESIDKFLSLGEGSDKLIEERFQRVLGTSSVAVDRFINTVAKFSDIALAPALVEFTDSLNELLQDKDRIAALTELFKVLGQSLKFLLQSAEFVGGRFAVNKKRRKKFDKVAEESTVFRFLRENNLFGIGTLTDQNFSPKSKPNNAPVNDIPSLSVKNEVTIDDRGNILKSKTRVDQQNNSNLGRTLGVQQ